MIESALAILDDQDDQAMLDLLSGAVQIVRFQPGPELGGKAQDFKPGDAVWLSLDCPIANPFTGESAVCAEAIVLSIAGDDVHLITVRSRLLGAVPAARLCKRLPGEIMPGRKSISDARM